jgi:hypothetical protein
MVRVAQLVGTSAQVDLVVEDLRDLDRQDEEDGDLA